MRDEMVDEYVRKVYLKQKKVYNKRANSFYKDTLFKCLCDIVLKYIILNEYFIFKKIFHINRIIQMTSVVGNGRQLETCLGTTAS